MLFILNIIITVATHVLFPVHVCTYSCSAYSFPRFMAMLSFYFYFARLSIKYIYSRPKEKCWTDGSLAHYR